MIYRYFEVRCDYCGRTINHYPHRKPNNEVLRKDGIVHTSTKQFCSDECYANWQHDRQEKQYMNLRQQGKCFIAFYRELDPIMSYLVSEQIHQQYNLKHKKHV